MTGHIIFLVLTIVAVALLFFTIGCAYKQEQMRKEFDLNKGELFFKVHKPGDGIPGLIFVVIWTVFMFVFCYNEIRDNYCEKFDNGKIVKEVNYKYWKVDGEQVLKDSTIHYVPSRDKKCDNQ